ALLIPLFFPPHTSTLLVGYSSSDHVVAFPRSRAALHCLQEFLPAKKEKRTPPAHHGDVSTGTSVQATRRHHATSVLLHLVVQVRALGRAREHAEAETEGTQGQGRERGSLPI